MTLYLLNPVNYSKYCSFHVGSQLCFGIADDPPGSGDALGGCNTLADWGITADRPLTVASHGAQNERNEFASLEVYGLAGPDIRAVRLTFGDGRTVVSSVRDGAYWYQVTGEDLRAGRPIEVVAVRGTTALLLSRRTG